jgi:hypothetical protein
MATYRVREGQQLANEADGGVYEGGATVDLSEAEADNWIKAGVLVDPEGPEPEPVVVLESTPPHEPGDAVDGEVAESGVQELDYGEEPAVEEPAAEEVAAETEEEEGPPRPSASAPKVDWEDYVEAMGGDPTDMTKAELQAWEP